MKRLKLNKPQERRVVHVIPGDENDGAGCFLRCATKVHNPFGARKWRWEVDAVDLDHDELMKLRGWIERYLAERESSLREAEVELVTATLPHKPSSN